MDPCENTHGRISCAREPEARQDCVGPALRTIDDMIAQLLKKKTDEIKHTDF